VRVASSTANLPSLAAVASDADGVTFPVAGDWSFLDDWGDARSGGRRHRASCA